MHGDIIEDSRFRGALLIDRAAAHLGDYVSEDLESFGIDTVVVDPGETSSSQPIDVGVNGPCKNWFKSNWSEKMRSEAEFTTNGNRKRIPYVKLVHMVLDSLGKITKETIINSFIACGLNHWEDSLAPYEYISKSSFFFTISIRLT